jgi:hypothetical protein
MYPVGVEALVKATLGYLISFFDRLNSVTTLEFASSLAVFDVYWRSTTGIFKVAFLISKVPVGGYIDILFLLS